MTTSQIEHSLYGLNELNCCKKKDTSEKVVNALLPVSYLLYAMDNGLDIQMLNKDVQLVCAPDIVSNKYVSTEVSWLQPQFIHSPPHDICLQTAESTEQTFCESKVVMFKGDKTELILRQDCFAFNILQNIINNNATFDCHHLDDIVSSSVVQESPYMLLLLWKKEAKRILFTCIVITDVAVLKMIHMSKTERSKQAQLLINKALDEHHHTGKMTYKASKKSTVPHQKVSLFPLRDIKLLNEAIRFEVDSTSLILRDVVPDTSLWQQVEKFRMLATIEELSGQINCFGLEDSHIVVQ
jgi:hypothetical protein